MRNRKILQPVLDQVPKKMCDTSISFRKCIQFGVNSCEEIAQSSEVEVMLSETFQFVDKCRQGTVPHGPLDFRLGPSEKSGQCTTCGEKLQECPGHFGHIRLVLPLFHVGYFRAIITTLQCICKTCSRIMLTESDRRSFLKRMRSPILDNMTRARILKQINAACRKHTTCPYCSASNGVVKKIGALKIIHDLFRDKKSKEAMDDFVDSFSTATRQMPELNMYISKFQDELHPLRVLHLFLAISNEDTELLGMNPDYGRPEQYLWTYLPVPPGVIRPSVARDSQESTEDSLTGKLVEILYINQMIRYNLAEGQPLQNVMEQWDFMQLTAGLYINSEMPGIPLQMALSQDTKRHRGFNQRLKGKQGRFRGNLSGKRVDFSGRTVISPDPNMRIDQVAVPVHVAKILTFPERVTDHNIDRLRQLVQVGNEVHPGANYVVEGTSGIKKSLAFARVREQAAINLRPGDTVERHMHDNDIVLFNRQPSLHKLSIMSHFAKIMPWRTFRFNECVCTPYNADFDGDEMNMHLPQTDEARSEAMELMGVKNNLVTPRNGEPIIAATQDFITASYLLSRKDAFFDRFQMHQMLMFMGDIKFDTLSPCIIKPVKLWTGKQILSMLLRPNKACDIQVNLETKTKSYETPCSPPAMCPRDGWLVIRNSEIMCGLWDKSVVGDGNKRSVFYVVLRDFGPIHAAECMNRLARLCARWLGNQGFSIGIQDVQAPQQLINKKESMIMTGYLECDELIRKSKAGELENQPGCNVEQTLEAKMQGVLNKIREDAGALCSQELNKYNAPLTMAICGSKGSKLNLSQMVACVGQQIIAGSRVPDGFDERSLPHFPKGSKIPGAKGFVRNSFFTGLTPTEFIFHAMSGREGLVDTAVKTAETGYMQRRLMKALEDLMAHYDRTVRDSSGGVVQFVYGDDSLDPANIEGANQPVEFPRNLTHALNVMNCTSELIMTPSEITAFVNQAVTMPEWSSFSAKFIESLKQFVETAVASEVARINLKSSKDPTIARVSRELFSINQNQLKYFLDFCRRKYQKALVEPGSAVGAVGAQSIGEPGTQMTLKTFHFAGVASMNVTLGVPRIKEIINAAKVINTPIVWAKLVDSHNEVVARIVKGRIETTKLGDIARYFEVVYDTKGAYLAIEIDWKAVSKLQLELSVSLIVYALSRAKSPKIDIMQIHMVGPEIQIRPRSGNAAIKTRPSKAKVNNDTGMFELAEADAMTELQQYKRMLPDVVIHGYPSIKRAVISKQKGDAFALAAEGYGLRDVMNTDGVIGTETKSNHVMEVEQVLGIEAARSTIIEQIDTTMESHGLTIDPRHTMLLSDVMTFKGEVLGITRFGVSKMKDSVLMLASFEKTTDHLFDASLYSKRDPIDGVSECIIMGIPMPIGSGVFKIVQKVDSEPQARPKLLFDRPEYHDK